MKKKFHHYKTRSEVLEKIDSCHTEQEVSIKASNELDAEGDRIRAYLGRVPLETITSERDKEDWHGRYNRLQDCRRDAGFHRRRILRLATELQKLKQVLAEIDTTPMDLLGDDTGVRV